MKDATVKDIKKALDELGKKYDDYKVKITDEKATSYNTIKTKIYIDNESQKIYLVMDYWR